MRQTLLASVMVLALCAPAAAGDMLTPPVAPPPPSSPAVQEPMIDVVIEMGAPATTADGLIETPTGAALIGVILNLLALS
ncbi:MAG TPA: hypothetical protein VFS10_21355 [Pyrinomonadaceae bacterium]|nr:hypothetical protein [Pyrinomonadaceae bacterium]